MKFPRRQPGRLLPFRIPFFRIFYSSTYTALYGLTLFMLAITPTSLIYTTFGRDTYQYIIMIGGTYVLVATCAIFIYSSRLYTNRTVLAGVGKSYVPIEEGEVGRSVRKMIVKQLERSAIVAWEGRPRDLYGEIMRAEQTGVLPADSESLNRQDYTLGREIPVDPAHPPWGRVMHDGWTSPEQTAANEMPNLQFAVVIKELPNLIEARAVSLAPPDPLSTPRGGAAVADPVVAGVLSRPETMGMRDYLTKLALLGLVDPPIGQDFLAQYEYARFSGAPVSESEFRRLMASFATLLAAMTGLQPEIIKQIRIQAGDQVDEDGVLDSSSSLFSVSEPDNSSVLSPVTARTNFVPSSASRSNTPYMQPESSSTESFNSVVHRMPEELPPTPSPYIQHEGRTLSIASSTSTTLPSDSGSVIRHARSYEEG